MEGARSSSWGKEGQRDDYCMGGLLDQREAAHRPLRAALPGREIATSGYNKNIFRYIIRKAFKLGTEKEYLSELQKCCLKSGAECEGVLTLMRSNAQSVSGMQFLKEKLRGCEGEAILDFLVWFLKSRYLRCLREKGRMREQQSYIIFKNKFALRQLRELKIEGCSP